MLKLNYVKLCRFTGTHLDTLGDLGDVVANRFIFNIRGYA